MREITEEEFPMKIVFPGTKDAKVSMLGGCGCACHPSIGEIASNKPSVQVR